MLVKHSHRKHFIDDSAHAKEKNPAKIVIGSLSPLITLLRSLRRKLMK